jgi:hypothetical protein
VLRVGLHACIPPGARARRQVVHLQCSPQLAAAARGFAGGGSSSARRAHLAWFCWCGSLPRSRQASGPAWWPTTRLQAGCRRRQGARSAPRPAHGGSWRATAAQTSTSVAGWLRMTSSEKLPESAPVWEAGWRAAASPPSWMEGSSQPPRHPPSKARLPSLARGARFRGGGALPVAAVVRLIAHKVLLLQCIRWGREGEHAQPTTCEQTSTPLQPTSTAPPPSTPASHPPPSHSSRHNLLAHAPPCLHRMPNVLHWGMVVAHTQLSHHPPAHYPQSAVPSVCPPPACPWGSAWCRWRPRAGAWLPHALLAGPRRPARSERTAAAREVGRRPQPAAAGCVPEALVLRRAWHAA